MSKSGRHATFPLDCDAQKAANDKVKEAMGGDPNERDSDRRIRIDGSDEHYRQMWMDAYIKAGGGFKHTPQKRKLGQPVTNCLVSPPPVKPDEKANLTVKIRLKGTAAPIGGALVTIKGKDGTKKTLQTDQEYGLAEFRNIKPGHYDIDTEHADYDATKKNLGTEVESYTGNLVDIELRDAAKVNRLTHREWTEIKLRKGSPEPFSDPDPKGGGKGYKWGQRFIDGFYDDANERIRSRKKTKVKKQHQVTHVRIQEHTELDSGSKILRTSIDWTYGPRTKFIVVTNPSGKKRNELHDEVLKSSKKNFLANPSGVVKPSQSTKASRWWEEWGWD